MNPTDSLDTYWKRLAYNKYDLSNCESEPLAFCGAVQSCGMFLSAEVGSGILNSASINGADYLGTDVGPYIGKTFSELLSWKRV
jgi:light-regulated signal transduction histidine kinase (bacteriophytochrome)